MKKLFSLVNYKILILEKRAKKKTILYDFGEKNLGLLPPTFLLDLSGEWGFKSGKIPTHGQIVEEFGQGVDLNVSGFVNSSPFTINVYFIIMK